MGDARALLDAARDDRAEGRNPMNTLSNLHIDLIVELVEVKMLDMAASDMAEAKEIAILKDCRELLRSKARMSGRHIERLIDLVEIRLICGSDEGIGAKESVVLTNCRATLLDVAAKRMDVKVIPLPGHFLAHAEAA